jgi:hypothetical protein
LKIYVFLINKKRKKEKKKGKLIFRLVASNKFKFFSGMNRNIEILYLNLIFQIILSLALNDKIKDIKDNFLIKLN